MKVVLAEKPSVARDIAAVIGCHARRDGYLEGNGYQITWAFGHLVSLKEPEDYDAALKKWSLDTLPFIPDKFELKATGDKGARQQLSVIKQLFRAADEIICATDAGREGELIFRYILTLTGCTKKPCQRLWLSSLTSQAIKQAFASLKPLSDYDNLYDAARCRNQADWIVGLNGTRYFTVRYQNGKTLWSVGRVQTPVLALIDGRDEHIKHFKPKPYWELLTKYRSTLFRHAEGRFDEVDVANGHLKRVLQAELAIENVTRRKQQSLPPLLYDLNELQRDMNRRFGVSAADTLQAVQTLYENKLVTYPRTDSRYLTKDMEATIPKVLEKLAAVRPDQIGKLDLDHLAFSGRITNDKKVTDHHAIIPTGKSPSSLSEVQKQAYDAVLTRFIAVFYPPCENELTTVDAQSASVRFVAKGTRTTSPGWTELYDSEPVSEDTEEEQSLPAFTAGESGPHEPYVREGKTTPPKHFTENTLLGAMETAGKLVDEPELREALKEKGLGTPATRAATIETLLKRKYITRTKTKLTVTESGHYLLTLIQDEHLKSPDLTGDWEERLAKIERGEADADTFMLQIAEYTRTFIRTNEETAKSDLPAAPTAQAKLASLGNCPLCKAAVVEQKKSYSCSAWKEGCKFTIWKTMAGKKLSPSTARVLLRDGKTSLLKGFTSKAGKKFDARLKIAGSKVEFDFPPRSK